MAVCSATAVGGWQTCQLISGKSGAEKNLGGPGSGRHRGHGLNVDKCHEYHSIDLAWLRRRKLDQFGQWSTLKWSRGGQETGAIRVQYLESGLRLVYRHGRDEQWTCVDEVVPFIEMPLDLGGKRVWFNCPSCHRHCRILYGGNRFRCRLCYRLRYDTQYEPPFARAATRALKIRQRLGCDGGIDDFFPPRPKGMHSRTYTRLKEIEEELQARWAQGIMARFRVD